MNAITLGNRILDVFETHYLPHVHCTLVVECRGVLSKAVGIFDLKHDSGSYRSDWRPLTPNQIRRFQYENNKVVNITPVQPQLLRAVCGAITAFIENNQELI